MSKFDFSEYLIYRDSIDKQVLLLVDEHHNHMTCHKGCDSCCFAFSVFPVEFYAIAQATGLTDSGLSLETSGELVKCAHLKDHACTIYINRPLICRTHGLPLLNMNESGEEWELNVCELNFTTFDGDDFEEDNVFVQDTMNSELYQLNKRFLEANPHINMSEGELILLSRLK